LPIDSRESKSVTITLSGKIIRAFLRTVRELSPKMTFTHWFYTIRRLYSVLPGKPRPGIGMIE
jgi:hypothetical protein